MRIQDRASNRVVADVHPLVAAEAARISGGNKLRLQYVSPYAVIVWNTDNGSGNMRARSLSPYANH